MANPWDCYIDHVKGKGQLAVDKVVLIGLNGNQCGAIWTPSHQDALTITAEEAKDIATKFADESKSLVEHFRETGIVINSVKYMFLRADEDAGLVLIKKKEHGAITIQKSCTAIVLAHTMEGKNQGSANNAVADCVDYLKQYQC